METTDSKIHLLLHQHDTAFDALKLWIEELNKLIYWKILLYAAAATLYSQKLELFFPFLALASVSWLYFYRRASLWYQINTRYLQEIRKRINVLLPDIYVYNQLHKIQRYRPTTFSGSILSAFASGLMLLLCGYLQVKLQTEPQAIKGDLVITLAIWALAVLLFGIQLVFPLQKVKWNIFDDEMN